ncbi:protein mono-ADP-ribosyltransferase PARP10 isoform X2 [Corvus hawaiiensis]|uniref:protein mono-ADP-ribosyltransferase PARP10 isoform X2 n=1 Tax=Corvus hawaiiensis TaxID=134902 RepID=UPI0020192FE8|nr:protein mono-ADP-ribosyltransferase PARP10 isoform X2 [Corvus hawaiiensis]
MCGCPRMAGGVLEVQGVPPDAPEELLVLYFESRRRSGGGPVQSCQRLGPLLFLTFEDPQDAQNVLAHGSHRLGGAELEVRPAPPWDPTHLLLHGLDPRTTPEHLDLPLETLLGVPPGTVTQCQGPAPGWGLLRLRDPLAPPELASAEQRARQQGLALLRVPRSPAVLVRAAAAPALSQDLLELYFENRRSGGGCVRDVRLLPAGRGAVVTFQEPAAAERVLQRPHRLQDVVLELIPHYPFLEPPEESTDLPLDTVPPLDRAPPPDTEPLLVMDPLLDVECPLDTDPCSDTDAPVADTNPTPDRAAAVPAPAAPTSHPVPEQPSPAVPGGNKDTEGFNAVPSQAQCPGPVSVVVPEAVSAVLAQDEALVPAEPGAVRYLQQHYQDVLDSIPEVSLLPLEGGDISGFRVSGEPGRCQAVVDFLRSLLDSVTSHPTTLHFPGIARFLRDPAGQSLLRQVESRFQCIIQLDGKPWSPPDPQPELEELLPLSSHCDSWHQDLPEDSNATADNGDDGDNAFHSNVEEIKEVLAALHPSEDDDCENPSLWPDTVPGTEWDPDAEFPSVAGGEGARELLSDTRVEEEVQMALAIQYSMESTRCEEVELARATALSLRSYCREQEQAEEDAGLLAALEASLEEALLAADVAQVTVFCSFEQDVSAVRQELDWVLVGQLRAQEVVSERLRALPATGHCALALLRRRHAVHLSLCGDTATLRGFAKYTAPAAQDLVSMLQRPLPPGHGATAVTTATAVTAATAATAATTAAARWVRWDPSGTAVPYAPEAVAQLEQAWLRRERKLDLVLDGRPFTVDLERMEEFNIGSALAVPICRSQPPLESTSCLLETEVAGLEEEVRLLALAEDSEEFADAVHHFYGTLEELHSQISIVQVQKLIHPVLYKQYQLKKGSVKRACAAGTVVERILFHGTTKASSREICVHGFNRSFCGKNATLYGLGVYFAARAAISARDRYSPPSAKGTKFIFVAKVLTGEFTAGQPGLRAPPLREGSGAHQRYHSVVDDPRQPDIFVIFNDTQAYPQYLITCRCRRRRHGAPPDPPGSRSGSRTPP